MPKHDLDTVMTAITGETSVSANEFNAWLTATLPKVGSGRYVENQYEQYFRMYYGLGDCEPMSFAAIAEHFNVSQNGVRVRVKEHMLRSLRAIWKQITEPDPEAHKDVLERSVDRLEVSVRTYNAIRNAACKTIGDLVKKNEREFLKKRGFGRKSLNELKSVLCELGLRLGM